MVSMNRLDTAKRAAVVRCLVEGCSIRSTVRMTGVAKNTVAKLLIELGACCTKFHGRSDARTCPANGFRLMKSGASSDASRRTSQPRKSERDGIVGSVWTWTAIDADTKLIPCWMIGTRDAGCGT